MKLIPVGRVVDTDMQGGLLTRFDRSLPIGTVLYAEVHNNVVIRDIVADASSVTTRIKPEPEPKPTPVLQRAGSFPD